MEERKKRGGEVKKLSDLFKVYSTRFAPPQKSVIKAAVEVIGDLFPITVKESDCAYTPSSQILKLNIRGPIKTEVLLRKKEILIHLQGRLGVKNAPKEIL